MWIRTQNKQRLVNSDQIIDIFIGKAGTKIIATTTCNDLTEITLGEYKDRETCLKVLERITIGMGSILPGIPMPLGGEVDTWTEGIDKIAAIDIANDFVSKVGGSYGRS